jgi:cytochrome c
VSRRAIWIVVGLVTVAAAAITVALAEQGSSEPRYRLAGASASRGRTALESYGCGSCHTIPGVRAADASVGPPLSRMGVRAYVAGRLPNTPGNLVAWIMDPQRVDPGNAMPDLGVPKPIARDMAQYLYTLR